MLRYWIYLCCLIVLLRNDAKSQIMNGDVVLKTTLDYDYKIEDTKLIDITDAGKYSRSTAGYISIGVASLRDSSRFWWGFSASVSTFNREQKTSSTWLNGVFVIEGDTLFYNSIGSPAYNPNIIAQQQRIRWNVNVSFGRQMAIYKKLVFNLHSGLGIRHENSHYRVESPLSSGEKVTEDRKKSAYLYATLIPEMMVSVTKRFGVLLQMGNIYAEKRFSSTPNNPYKRFGIDVSPKNWSIGVFVVFSPKK